MAQTNSTKLRQVVSLSLSTALVAAARDVTDDLSGTVEMLLARHVNEARHRENGDVLDQVLAALNSFHADHGFLSDEFSTL